MQQIVLAWGKCKPFIYNMPFLYKVFPYWLITIARTQHLIPKKKSVEIDLPQMCPPFAMKLPVIKGDWNVSPFYKDVLLTSATSIIQHSI